MSSSRYLISASGGSATPPSLSLSLFVRSVACFKRVSSFHGGVVLACVSRMHTPDANASPPSRARTSAPCSTLEWKEKTADSPFLFLTHSQIHPLCGFFRETDHFSRNLVYRRCSRSEYSKNERANKSAEKEKLALDTAPGNEYV